MRSNDTYRGVIRNFLHTSVVTNLSDAMHSVQRGWRHANIRAKLKERYEQTKKSLWHFSQGFAAAASKLGRFAGFSVLTTAGREAQLKFWQNEKPSRVVSRICMELS